MKKVFYEALIRTNKKEFYKYWLTGSLGTTIALFTLGSKYLKLTDIESIKLGLVLLLIVFFIRYIYFIILLGYRRAIFKYRESLYGDIIVLIKESFDAIHNLRRTQDIDDSAFKSVLVHVCNNLKVIFEKKTGVDCSVSIKALKIGVNNHISSDTEVFTLCRDKVSFEKRDKYQQVKHQVFSNTCYNVIFDNLSRKRKQRLYYINNDIPIRRKSEGNDLFFYPQSGNYQNTSYDVYDELPYKSEIVVPITRMFSEEDTHFNLLGFICVDCTKNNVFDESYDLTILQLISDGVYDLFSIKLTSF